VPTGLVNTELTLEFFQRNFTPEFITSNVEKITFCGDDGDPIYAHDLIPVIRYIKSVKPVEIIIVTNGSYKKSAWWQDLGNALTGIDSVHFSVDGIDQAMNNQYRVNSDYASIVEGIRTLRSNSNVQIVWATIAFSFNQDYLEKIKSFAKQLGMDRFQLTCSTKFSKVYPIYGERDTLEPRAEYISSTERFERKVTDFTQRSNPIPSKNIELYRAVDSRELIKPLCSVGNKGLYISATGLLYPCCWVANRYAHNSEWQTIAGRFNLNLRSLTDCLQDEFWKTEFQTYKWRECQTKCSANIVDENYATEW